MNNVSTKLNYLSLCTPLRCGVQKVQDMMLAEVQEWCRGCRGGPGAVQAVQERCRGGAGGAGTVQATCTICTSASIISGARRCRRCRHTSGTPKNDTQRALQTARASPLTVLWIVGLHHIIYRHMLHRLLCRHQNIPTWLSIFVLFSFLSLLLRARNLLYHILELEQLRSQTSLIVITLHKRCFIWLE